MNFYTRRIRFIINETELFPYTDTILSNEEDNIESVEYYSIDNNTISQFVNKLMYIPGKRYEETLFRRRGFFRDGFKVDRFYVDEMKTAVIKIDYAPLSYTPSFKELSKYPADKVIQYLKERGITSCPIGIDN